jgi:predicted nucleic acid-binding protein
VNVFLDTNVVLDVFAVRRPFYGDSAQVWTLSERGRIRGVVSAVSMTTVYYVLRRQVPRARAMDALRSARACVGLASCGAAVIDRAIDSGFRDSEDAVQYFSALAADADAIVTRNTDHFPKDEVPVMTPAAFLAAHTFE